ncbi:MAG: hypothetical protein QF773_04855, partial [Lentisphaeria bacterium]|nr:hypothetical protein [Lentisphaeria bacterium]
QQGGAQNNGDQGWIDQTEIAFLACHANGKGALGSGSLGSGLRQCRHPHRGHSWENRGVCQK